MPQRKWLSSFPPLAHSTTWSVTLFYHSVFFALGLTLFLSEAWCTTMYWWVLSVNSIISDISIETWEEKLDLANCERKQSLDQGLHWKHQEVSSCCRLHLSLMNIFWSGSLGKTGTYRVYTSRDSTSFLTFSTRWSNSTKLFLIRMNMKPTCCQKLPEAEKTVNVTLNQLTINFSTN